MKPIPAEENKLVGLADRAQLLIDLGRVTEAIPLLAQALINSPDSYDLLCRMAYAYFRLNENEKALEYVGQAMHANPAGEWSFRLRSYLRQRLGLNDLGLQDALEALRLDPDSRLGLQTAIDAQIKCNLLQEAKATAYRLRQIAPELAASYGKLGDLAYAEKDYTTAEGYYREALARDPESYSIHNDIGRTMLQLGRKREAAEAFLASLRLNPVSDVVSGNLRRTIQSHAKIRRGGLQLVFIAAFVLFLMAMDAFSGDHTGRLAVIITATAALLGLSIYLIWRERRYKDLVFGAGLFVQAERRREALHVYEILKFLRRFSQGLTYFLIGGLIIATLFVLPGIAPLIAIGFATRYLTARSSKKQTGDGIQRLNLK